jgi:hypothetical protein
MKPEIRGPKAEINSYAEIRSSVSNVRTAPAVDSDFGFRSSAFFRPSDFGLRIYPAHAG